MKLLYGDEVKNKVEACKIRHDRVAFHTLVSFIYLESILKHSRILQITWPLAVNSLRSTYAAHRSQSIFNQTDEAQWPESFNRTSGHCHESEFVLGSSIVLLRMKPNVNQTCWALIFIFKLQFPPGSSIATILKKTNFNWTDIKLWQPYRISLWTPKKLNRSFCLLTKIDQADKMNLWRTNKVWCCVGRVKLPAKPRRLKKWWSHYHWTS